MRHLTTIESLRAYLAIWVVLGHGFEVSGYRPQTSDGLLRLLMIPHVAVKLFVIVSGFVIFALLRAERETYHMFILRRFLRLYPLLVVTFLAAVPISLARLWNIDHAASYLSPEWAHATVTEIHAWWEHLTANILLHLTLTHGLVPQQWIPFAPGAFLDAAWSVSLEWQFYIVAPFVYALVSRSRLGLAFVCAATVACLAVRRVLLPEVQYGAALPFHAEYFFVGALSYFVYEHRARAGSPTLVVACASLIVFRAGSKADELLPLCLWAVVLAATCEGPESFVARRVLPIFDSSVTRYLGRISYSIYLSHLLVLALVQASLLWLWPGLSRAQHVIVLLSLTLPLSVALSACLYRFVEMPGIRLGRSLSRTDELRPRTAS